MMMMMPIRPSRQQQRNDNPATRVLLLLLLGTIAATAASASLLTPSPTLQYPDNDSSPNTTFSSTLLPPRLLQSNTNSKAFAGLNAILSDARIAIGSATVSEGLLLHLGLHDILCYDVRLADVSLRSVQTLPSAVNIYLDISGLDVTCGMDYTYRTLLFSGRERRPATVVSQGNSARLTVTLSTSGSSSSSSLTDFPPTQANVRSCTAELDITSIDIEGGIWGLAPVERVLSRIVQRRASDQVCTLLASFDMTQWLNLVQDHILEPYPREYVFPTMADMERQAVVAAKEKDVSRDWLQWQSEPEHESESSALANTSTIPAPPLTQWGHWFQQALTYGTEWLTAKVTLAPDASDTDLRINQLLRDHVLNGSFGTGALNLTRNNLTWRVENRVTATTITFTTLQLIGLDRLEHVAPFTPIGRHTMESSLAWRSLECVVHATVRMVPSTAPDAIVSARDRTSSGTTEHVTLRWTLGRVQAAVFVTALVDADGAARMPLGNVLRQPLACAMSLIDALQVSRLDFRVNEHLIVEPILEGFVDPGLDRLFTSAVGAAMDVYQPLLLQSLPAFFDTTVRDALQTAVLDRWRKHVLQNETPCAAMARTPTSTTLGQASNAPLDWRDLLLDPEAAALVGGSGGAPYGTMVSYIMQDVVQQRWLDADTATGRPKINTALAMMESSMSYPDMRSELQMSTVDTFVPAQLLQSVTVGMEGVVWRHLDSVVAPLTLLAVKQQPVTDNLTLLRNQIQFGAKEDVNGTQQSLQFTTRVHMRAAADNPLSPLLVDNTLELAVRLQPSISMDARVLLDENGVMMFPMQDLLHADCWAAALLGAPDLPMLDVGLSGLDVQLRCISCSSSGASRLAALSEELHSLEFFELLGNLAAKASNDILLSYWNDSLELPQMIGLARLRCPHSPLYVPDGAVAQQDWPGMPPLSDAAAQMLAHTATMAMQLWLITLSHGHLNTTAAVVDDDSVVPEVLDSGRFIDWNNLGDTLGDWADSGLQQIRDITSKTVIDEATGERVLAINSLMEDNDGTWTFPSLDGPLFAIGSNEVFVSNFRLEGLNTFTLVQPWNAVAAQSIETKVGLGELSLEVDVGLDSRSEGNTTIGMILRDVELEIGTILKVVWDELSDVKIGSLLEARKILPCLASHVREAALTSVKLTASAVSPPTTTSDADEELRLIAEAFFQNHEADFLQSLPTVTNTTLRQSLNTILSNFKENQDEVCQVPAAFRGGNVVDFRDLLLSKESAMEYGGSGSAPYGDMFPLMFQLVKDQLSNDGFGSDSVFNKLLVHPVTSSQSNVNGSILMHDVYNTQGSADISNWSFDYMLSVSELSVQNLDSIHSPFSILQPVKGLPTTLRSALMVGKAESPLELSVIVHFNLQDDQGNRMDNKIGVSLELNHISLVLSVLVALSETALFSLPLKEVKDANCWIATIHIDSLKDSLLPLLNYSLSAEHALLNVTCLSCSTPKFDALAQQIYSPGSSPEEIQSFLDQSKNSVDQFLGSEFFQNLLSVLVADAKTLCPNNSDYDATAPASALWKKPAVLFRSNERDSKMRVFTIVNTILGAALVVSFFAARLFIQRKGRMLRSGGSLADLSALLDWQEGHQMSKHTFVDASTHSLFNSDTISIHARYFVPGMISLNLALFIYGHIALLSYLNVEADVGGERLSIRRFLEFVFFKDARRTYKAGGGEMALMLILFSGVWPYIKLVAAFTLWFLPPRIMSTSRRGYLLLWMDVLSKLSIIDITMTLFAVAVFLVYIGGPGENFYQSKENFYSLTVVVVPKAGFYCLLVAQRMNRLGSRFLLECHQKVVDSALSEYESQAGTNDWRAEIGVEAVAVRGTPTRLPPPLDPSSTTTSTASPVPASQPGRVQSALTNSFIVDAWMKINAWSQEGVGKLSSSIASCACFRRQMAGTCSVVLGCICVLALLIIGCAYAPAISINVEEILSMGLESGRSLDITVQDVNVFSVFCGILLQCRFVMEKTTDFVGLGILLGLAMVSSFLFPVAQGIKKIIAWTKTDNHWTFLLRPQSFSSAQPAASRSFLYHPRAWENVEVFIIAFSMATWQLGAVTSYVIHSYCQGLLLLFDSLSTVGIVDSQPGVNCFRTQASDPLTLVVIIGAFLSVFVSFLYQVIMQYRKNVDKMRLDIATRSDSPHSHDSESGLPMTDAEHNPTKQDRWILKMPLRMRNIFRKPCEELQITVDTGSTTDALDDTREKAEASIGSLSGESLLTATPPEPTEVGGSSPEAKRELLQMNAVRRWMSRIKHRASSSGVG